MSFSYRLNLKVLIPEDRVVLPRDLGGEQELPAERDMCGLLIGGLAVNIKVGAVTLMGNPTCLALPLLLFE